jgi:diaminopimelate epimerase
MTGPAVAVFDGVVTPELWGEDADDGGAGPSPVRVPLADSLQRPIEPSPDRTTVGEVDCATACVNGCLRPEACPSAEARARVAALLSSSSLDDLVALATNSLESRTRARVERDSGPFG